MTKEFWINLPVKDINRSRAFFTQMGFAFNEHYGNSDDSISLVIGQKKIIVMFFKEAAFEIFTGNKIADTTKGTEILLSIDAESIEEVDAIMKRAEEAGGNIFHPAGSKGWLYGGGFADPDGHRWNVLYMDMSKMPQS